MVVNGFVPSPRTKTSSYERRPAYHYSTMTTSVTISHDSFQSFFTWTQSGQDFRRHPPSQTAQWRHWHLSPLHHLSRLIIHHYGLEVTVLSQTALSSSESSFIFWLWCRRPALMNCWYHRPCLDLAEHGSAPSLVQLIGGFMFERVSFSFKPCYILENFILILIPFS